MFSDSEVSTRPGTSALTEDDVELPCQPIWDENLKKSLSEEDHDDDILYPHPSVEGLSHQERLESFRGWIRPKRLPIQWVHLGGGFKFPIFRYVNAEGIALSVLLYVLIGLPCYFLIYDILWTRQHKLYFPGPEYAPLWLDNSLFAHIMYWGSMAMLIYAHQKSMTTDPGIVRNYLDTKTLNEPPNLPLPFCAHYCGKCLALTSNDARPQWKPPRAYHCKHCQECVFGMDHHCPWINNCVGYFNIRYFLQFLQWLWMHAFITLMLILNLLWRTNYSIRVGGRYWDVPYCTIFWDILFFNRGAFSLVLCFMAFWLSITFAYEIRDFFKYDQTTIETHKNVRGSGWIKPFYGYQNDDGELPKEVKAIVDKRGNLGHLQIHGPLRNEVLPALIDSEDGTNWRQWILHRSSEGPIEPRTSLRLAYRGLMGRDIFEALTPTTPLLYANFADTPWGNFNSRKHPCYHSQCTGGAMSYQGDHSAPKLHPKCWLIDSISDDMDDDEYGDDTDYHGALILGHLRAGAFDFKEVKIEEPDDLSSDN